MAMAENKEKKLYGPNQCKVIHYSLCHFRHYCYAFYPVMHTEILLVFRSSCFTCSNAPQSLFFAHRLLIQYFYASHTHTCTRKQTQRLWTILKKLRQRRRVTKNHFSFCVFFPLIRRVRVNIQNTRMKHVYLLVGCCCILAQTLCVYFAICLHQCLDFVSGRNELFCVIYNANAREWEMKMISSLYPFS